MGILAHSIRNLDSYRRFEEVAEKVVRSLAEYAASRLPGHNAVSNHGVVGIDAFVAC